jgi:hypothetical protein
MNLVALIEIKATQKIPYVLPLLLEVPSIQPEDQMLPHNLCSAFKPFYIDVK